jgi:uncharacterized protein YndB with AHSA1/START domain
LRNLKVTYILHIFKVTRMKRDIKIKWFYPYPVETLWECLTDPEILKQWSLSSTDFRAEVGFKWMEAQKPRPKMNWDGKMYFEVLEVQPKQKLVYSFRGGPSEGVFNLDTVVTWTLWPKDNGTELQLEHTGFKGLHNFFASFFMEHGWKNKVAKRFAKSIEQLLHGHA